MFADHVLGGLLRDQGVQPGKVMPPRTPGTSLHWKPVKGQGTGLSEGPECSARSDREVPWGSQCALQGSKGSGVLTAEGTQVTWQACGGAAGKGIDLMTRVAGSGDPGLRP